MNAELEQLGESIAELAAHLDAAAHRLLAALREFDQRGGWHTQGALSCAHWLAWRVGWYLVTARERVRVARKLGEFPTIDDTLRRGEVSYSKVRALLRIATPANEAVILEHARLTTASQLEKVSRKYARVQRHDEQHRPQDDELRRYVRRRDTDDGMVKIEAVLHPEEAELIWSMLDHAAKQLARQSDHAPLRVDPRADSAEPARGSTAAKAIDCGDAAASSPAPDAALSRDSAESCAMCETGRQGDCAESWQALDASLVPSNASGAAEAASTGACTSDEPAESSKVAERVMEVMESSSTSFAERCRAVVCGDESNMVGDRSLLDRLLDEVDADRDARGAAWADADAGAGAEHLHELPSESPVTVPLQAAVGAAMHQRADARKRAFCRADALCSIAQAYLRGERVERAPVDVVLTISASGLRREAIGYRERGRDPRLDGGCASDELRCRCDRSSRERAGRTSIGRAKAPNDLRIAQARAATA